MLPQRLNSCALLLLLWALPVSAGWLQCPYENSVNELQAPLRYVALAALSQQFEPLRAPDDLQSWPMQREFEVAGVTPTAPNDALLFLDFAPFPPELVNAIHLPVAEGGGGCVTLTEPQMQVRLIPGRVPRLVQATGALTFDATDATRPQIGLESLQRAKAGRQGSVPPAMPSLFWHYALSTLRWLQPALAIAAQAFPHPDYGVFETFTYSTGNLDTVSSNVWKAGPHTATTLAVNASGRLIRQTGVNGDSFYTKRLFNFDRGGDFYFTVITANATQSIRHYFCLTQDSTLCTVYNGYSIRWLRTSGSPNDTVGLLREDNGIETLVSTTITGEFITSDVLGVRDNGGDFSFYQNGTNLGTRTDTTYRGRGVLGILISGSDTWLLDTVGGGATAPSGWRAAR